MEKMLLTRAGYEKIMRELEFLSRVERPQVVQEILEAAQEGGTRKTPTSSQPWPIATRWNAASSSCSKPWPTPGAGGKQSVSNKVDSIPGQSH
jgi:hypothetical protein